MEMQAWAVSAPPATQQGLPWTALVGSWRGPSGGVHGQAGRHGGLCRGAHCCVPGPLPILLEPLPTWLPCQGSPPKGLLWCMLGCQSGGRRGLPGDDLQAITEVQMEQKRGGCPRRGACTRAPHQATGAREPRWLQVEENRWRCPALRVAWPRSESHLSYSGAWGRGHRRPLWRVLSWHQGLQVMWDWQGEGGQSGSLAFL